MKFGSNEAYETKVHRYGRTSLWVALLLMFLFPLSLWVVYGICPSKSELMYILINTSSVLLPTAIIELMSYAPVLGSSGMYMMTLAGSYMSIRIPSALASINSSGAAPQTEENDIFATIGVAASVFVSVTVLILCAVMMKPLMPIVNAPVMQPAFSTVLPALYGGMLMAQFLGNYKLCVCPFIIAMAVVKFHLIPSSIIFPGVIILSLLTHWILYKAKVLK